MANRTWSIARLKPTPNPGDEVQNLPATGNIDQSTTVSGIRSVTVFGSDLSKPGTGDKIVFNMNASDQQIFDMNSIFFRASADGAGYAVFSDRSGQEWIVWSSDWASSNPNFLDSTLSLGNSSDSVDLEKGRWGQVSDPTNGTSFYRYYTESIPITAPSRAWDMVYTVYSGNTLTCAQTELPIIFPGQISNQYNQVLVESGGQLNANSLSIDRTPNWGTSGSLTVNSGGAISGTFTVQGSGTMTLDTGATISGNVNVISGGRLNGGTFTSGSTLSVGQGSLVEGVNLIGGELIASFTPSVKVMSGATVTLQSGAVWTVANVSENLGNNKFTVQSGATLWNASAVVSSDTVTVNSGGFIRNMSAGAGINVILQDGAVIQGDLRVANGGHLTVDPNATGVISLKENAGCAVTFTGIPQEDLYIKATVSGYSKTNGIGFDGISQRDVRDVSYPSTNVLKLDLYSGVSVYVNITNVANIGYELDDISGSLAIFACFLAGTMIRTPAGQIAIENIRAGDTVRTFNWQLNEEEDLTVIWTGTAHWDVKPHLPDDEAGWPVRILENALAEGVPFKDMLVTAEHCLFFDGQFIPVRMLVNGRTIIYDHSITSYDYYHIETEDHSVIMADGILTESYLDTGNRLLFNHDDKVVPFTTRALTWETDASAPHNVAQSFVEPVFRQIETRACANGISLCSEPRQLTKDADFYLMTETGTVIRHIRESNDRYVFMIPPNLTAVRLVSRTSRPCDTIGPFVDDRRQLGVLVGHITLFDATGTYKIDTYLTQENLSGWDVVENVPCRWTNGYALLPLNERTPYNFSILSIHLMAAGPYLTKQTQKLANQIAAQG